MRIALIITTLLLALTLQGQDNDSLITAPQLENTKAEISPLEKDLIYLKARDAYFGTIIKTVVAITGTLFAILFYVFGIFFPRDREKEYQQRIKELEQLVKQQKTKAEIQLKDKVQTIRTEHKEQLDSMEDLMKEQKQEGEELLEKELKAIREVYKQQSEAYDQKIEEMQALLKQQQKQADEQLKKEVLTFRKEFERQEKENEKIMAKIEFESIKHRLNMGRTNLLLNKENRVDLFSNVFRLAEVLNEYVTHELYPGHSLLVDFIKDLSVLNIEQELQGKELKKETYQEWEETLTKLIGSKLEKEVETNFTAWREQAHKHFYTQQLEEES